MSSSDLPRLNWSILRMSIVTNTRNRKLELITVLSIFGLVRIFESLRSLPIWLWVEPSDIVFNCHSPLLILASLLLFNSIQHAIWNFHRWHRAAVSNVESLIELSLLLARRVYQILRLRRHFTKPILHMWRCPCLSCDHSPLRLLWIRARRLN